ncbi:MAG: hypothetical protein QW514_08555 [Thermoprotei archaeon]
MHLREWARLSAESVDLSQTDRQVYEFMLNSGLRLSFQGLRRSLRIHQESLSRSLKRLVELGLVSKVGDEYVVKQHGADSAYEWYVVIESVLPYNVNVQSVALAMKEKWFKDLRWLGMSLDGRSLVWTSVDGSIKIMVRFVDNQVVVETDAYTSDKLTQAIRLSHTVFEHLSKIVSKGGILPQASN